MGEKDFVTDLMNKFITQCDNGINTILPDVYWLIGALGVIQIASSAIFNLENDQIKNLVKNILKIGFIIFLAEHWIDLCDQLSKSFAFIAFKAGGLAGDASAQTVLSPSYVANRGIKVCSEVINSIVQVGGSSVAATLSQILLKIVLVLVIFIAFVFMALQIFLTVVEFHIIKTVSLILIPFGLVKQTRFLFEKAIGALWSFGIKLAVLCFLLAITMPMISSWNNIDASKISTILASLVGAVALAYLIWQAPNIAQGLLSGTPSLSASHAIASAAIAGAVAYRLFQNKNRREEGYRDSDRSIYRDGGGSGGGNQDVYRRAQIPRPIMGPSNDPTKEKSINPFK